MSNKVRGIRTPMFQAEKIKVRFQLVSILFRFISLILWALLWLDALVGSHADFCHALPLRYSSPDALGSSEPWRFLDLYHTLLAFFHSKTHQYMVQSCEDEWFSLTRFACDCERCHTDARCEAQCSSASGTYREWISVIREVWTKR